MKDLFLNDKGEQALLQALEVYIFDHKIEKWGVCFTEEKPDGSWRAGGMACINGVDHDLIVDFKDDRLEVSLEVIHWII